MFDHTFETTTQTCPACKASCDAATAFDHDNKPAPGAIVVCGFCGAILVFSDAMRLEVMPQTELAKLPAKLQNDLALMGLAAKASSNMQKVEANTYTIAKGPNTTELLDALEASGMRRLNCEGCGCEMLTRGDANKCPPCRDPEQLPVELPAELQRLFPRMNDLFKKVLAERAYELGGVLGRMIELVSGDGPPVSFGAALAQASAESGVRVPRGSEEETLLLTHCFQIVTSGRIPGIPDA